MPASLVVDPRQLTESQQALADVPRTVERILDGYHGPRLPPQLGDPACTAAFAAADQQLGGLVTAAAAESRALAAGLQSAAALYSSVEVRAAPGDASTPVTIPQQRS